MNIMNIQFFDSELLFDPWDLVNNKLFWLFKACNIYHTTVIIVYIHYIVL